jgi:hypothetical protein
VVVQKIIMIQRPSFLKIMFYLFIKYIMFFIVLGFMNNRFKTIVIDKAINNHEMLVLTFYYFIEVLFTTILLVILLIVPLYFLFKLNNPIYCLLAFFLVIILEYFLYESGCSYIHFDIDGIINGIISIIFFPLFFGKFIISLSGACITDRPKA